MFVSRTFAYDKFRQEQLEGVSTEYMADQDAIDEFVRRLLDFDRVRSAAALAALEGTGTDWRSRRSVSELKANMRIHAPPFK